MPRFATLLLFVLGLGLGLALSLGCGSEPEAEPEPESKQVPSNYSVGYQSVIDSAPICPDLEMAEASVEALYYPTGTFSPLVCY